jgi:hypothetical protein
MGKFINRRDFLLSCFRFFSFFIGIKAIGLSRPLQAEESSGGETSASFPQVPIGGHFIGENLAYEMTFMMLFNAARLILRLLPHGKDNHYLVSFRAETKGFVGWIVGYRKYHFKTVVEEVDGGKRFLPHRFETSKIIKKKKLKKIYQFDYEKKELQVQHFNQDKLKKSFTVPFIPGKPYNDILSLFYNFRYGAFGPIEKERQYQFLGIPKNNKDKKEVPYTVHFYSEKDEKDQRDDFDWEEPGYVAKIKIDKDILATKEGIIWVLLDRNMIPLKGIIEDAVVLGDVVGVLDRPEVNSSS